MDVLAAGHSLGAQPLDREVASTRLRFGVVQQTMKGEARRAAFGIAGTMGKLEKGQELY